MRRQLARRRQLERLLGPVGLVKADGDAGRSGSRAGAAARPTTRCRAKTRRRCGLGVGGVGEVGVDSSDSSPRAPARPALRRSARQRSAEDERREERRRGASTRPRQPRRDASHAMSTALRWPLPVRSGPAWAYFCVELRLGARRAPRYHRERVRAPARGGSRRASALDPPPCKRYRLHSLVDISASSRRGVRMIKVAVWGTGMMGQGLARLHPGQAQGHRPCRRHRPPSREARAHRGRDHRLRLRHPRDRRLRERARQEARRRMHSDREQPPRDRRPGRGGGRGRRQRHRHRRDARVSLGERPRVDRALRRARQAARRLASWAPASTPASCSTRCRSR